jgi:asparagine N-glycosylation enzyme membrane subunit Stt3
MSRNPYVGFAWAVLILALLGGVAVFYIVLSILGRTIERLV